MGLFKTKQTKKKVFFLFCLKKKNARPARRIKIYGLIADSASTCIFFYLAGMNVL